MITAHTARDRAKAAPAILNITEVTKQDFATSLGGKIETRSGVIERWPILKQKRHLLEGIEGYYVFKVGVDQETFFAHVQASSFEDQVGNDLQKPVAASMEGKKVVIFALGIKSPFIIVSDVSNLRLHCRKAVVISKYQLTIRSFKHDRNVFSYRVWCNTFALYLTCGVIERHNKNNEFTTMSVSARDPVTEEHPWF
mmetsp:Transcript_26685/g.40707  ORF Transcript_26685/g.40707 Transcript_26685/m.40707 type:complete len:197 (+) Transcript_26685:39-629(+)